MLALAMGLGACAAASDREGADTTVPTTTTEPAPDDQQTELDPELSYAPTCTSAGERRCLSGTEVQALEAFDGKLYAAMTNWEETLPRVWPATSAQVNVLGSEGEGWRRTPDLPGSPTCARGNAPWEQVNDLHAATFSWQGGTAKHLFSGVLANEDGACPGLQATAFSLDAPGRRWIDTGLGGRLAGLYGDVYTEVRYIESFSDGSADCPTERPCVFAFVNPRGGTIGPSVWRGTYDPTANGCRLLCWDPEPEVVMDGTQAPPALRIVASASGPDGLHFGTHVLGSERCRVAGDRHPCNRAALMHRVEPGVWEPVWVGTAAQDGGPEQVRGITSWEYEDGSGALWFVTGPVGTVYRIDTTATGARSAPVVETTLGELLPQSCGGRMLPYQLYVHEREARDQVPELLVASEACGRAPTDRIARIFHRSVAADGTWGVFNMPTVKSVGLDRSNEAAVRWILESPFDSNDIYFGTTDMNSGPGSLTARVYQVTLP